jgi:hypothetical protein
VERAADELQDAVLESMDWTSIYSGPPDEMPFINDVDHMRTWLTNELAKRRRVAFTAARFHLRASTQKPNEWGPATLKVVDIIVRKGKEAFGEDNPSNWGRSAKPRQRAEYYVGLLCIDAGLLRPKNQHSQKLIADVVRKRLDRGEPLRLADEQYPTYKPMPRTNPKKVADWTAKHFKS